MGRATAIGLMLVMALVSSSALAWNPDEILDDPALESRARVISKDLRCMVCQNQSIDDSDAPLARDLRILVRERLTEGDSNDEVIDFVVARYGEFVLLRPRIAPHTWLLWASPILVLGAGMAYLVARRRKPGAVPTDADALTAEEEARLKTLVEPDR